MLGIIARTIAASLVLLAALTPARTAAQQSTRARSEAGRVTTRADSVHEIRLRDGSILYGRIEHEDSARVVLVAMSGARSDIARSQIERRRRVSGTSVDGVFWADDPNGTRLFFTATARPLARGEGYISDYMLFFPMLAVGVTERFTMAGGSPIIPGAMGKVFYLAPKFAVVDRPRAAVSVGALGLFTSGGDDRSLGILYGVGTWGSRDHAITTGAGWGYTWKHGSDASLSDSPALVIGGETRVGRRAKLVMENWVLSGGDRIGISTGGVRFIGDRLSADLGMAATLDAGQAYCCLPIVNFVFNYGRQ